MNRRPLLDVLGDLADACYAAGEKGPDESVDLDPYLDRILALDAPVRYAAAAQIGIDDAAEQARDPYTVDQLLARAQAYAALGSLEQARIANLIGWKALQTQRQSGPENGIDLLPLAGDEITQQIEEGLGL